MLPSTRRPVFRGGTTCEFARVARLFDPLGLDPVYRVGLTNGGCVEARTARGFVQGPNGLVTAFLCAAHFAQLGAVPD